MKKIIVISVVFVFIGLQFGCTPAQVQGGGVGAGVGGIAGALLDHKNPWRGGLIGAALGGVFGATLGDISDRASYEAAQADRPARYRTEDGHVLYQADPKELDERTHCRKIRERVWEDDRLIKDQIREVCESEQSDAYYREERPRDYYYAPAPYYQPAPYYYYPYYGPSFYFFYGSGRHHRW
ncbi:MAG TPA: glycine zipper 2TM domain-containing protein [Dissulfurispiraceae bacterium]|nr:glycine zipper 2TM domain-containing protein [Dissulfurispiraceae bacterium]